MNVYDFLNENAQPDAVAIKSREEQTTYEQLIRATNRVAATLTLAGVEQGTRVGIIAPNSTFWVASYLAALKLGAVAVPFSARFKPQGFRDRQALVQCQYFCTTPVFLKRFGAEMSPDHVVVMEESPKVEENNRQRPRCFQVTKNDEPCSTVSVDEDDLAALMFTSGATGNPNAVKVTHRNIIANTTSIIEYLGLASDDRMLVVMPFDYCFAASLLHTHLRVGARVVLSIHFAFLEEVLNDLEQFECTGFAGVPSVYQSLLRSSSLPERQLSSLRHVQQAGGKLHTHLIKKFTELVPHVRFFVMYGQTEATARLSYLPPERLKDKLGSIGKGIPGVKLQVLNDSGQPVKPGEVGEIVAQGDNITAGYLAPDPDRQGFRDGKLYTGDLAKVDDDGFIYVVGRKKDFIKPFGYRIGCSEIEKVLLAVDKVVDAAVIGIPDDRAGEIAVAFVVLNSEPDETTSEQLQLHCKKELPDYGVPQQFYFVGELPKNPAGKTVKRLLEVPEQPE